MTEEIASGQCTLGSPAATQELNVGFGNTVALDKVQAILMPTSAPMKRLRDRAQEEGRLLDATSGRRTRSIIITDSNHVILSAVAPETLWHRARH